MLYSTVTEIRFFSTPDEYLMYGANTVSRVCEFVTFSFPYTCYALKAHIDIDNSLDFAEAGKGTFNLNHWGSIFYFST